MPPRWKTPDKDYHAADMIELGYGAFKDPNLDWEETGDMHKHYKAQRQFLEPIMTELSTRWAPLMENSSLLIVPIADRKTAAHFNYEESMRRQLTSYNAAVRRQRHTDEWPAISSGAATQFMKHATKKQTSVASKYPVFCMGCLNWLEWGPAYEGKHVSNCVKKTSADRHGLHHLLMNEVDTAYKNQATCSSLWGLMTQNHQEVVGMLHGLKEQVAQSSVNNADGFSGLREEMQGNFRKVTRLLQNQKVWSTPAAEGQCSICCVDLEGAAIVATCEGNHLVCGELMRKDLLGTTDAWEGGGG